MQRQVAAGGQAEPSPHVLCRILLLPVRTASDVLGCIADDDCEGCKGHARHGHSTAIAITVVAGRLEFSTTISKVIDFTDNSSDTGRGIYFNSRSALSAQGTSYDSWLRLNANSSFTNGVYTPGNFRADGTITANGILDCNSTVKIINGSATNIPLRFDGDEDTGIYRRASNQIGYATGGVARYGMSGNAFFPNQDLSLIHI